MGLATANHTHNYLRSESFVNAYYDSQDSARAVRLCGLYEFLDRAGTASQSICMSQQMTMFFNAWGITGADFEFNGDVRVGGDIYGGPAIMSSDVREKHDILDLSKRYEAMFQALRPVTFIYNEGHSGRTHIGFIAQEVERALLDAGLTTEEFAGFVKMPEFGTREIHEKEICVNEEGEEIEVPVTRTIVDTDIILDHRYKLRYDEFTALNTHMIQRLMQRVEELEAKVTKLEGKLNGN